MMDKPFALTAIHDDELWENIRHHRSVFTPIKGIDYEDTTRNNLRLTPPDEVRSVWKDDYSAMQEQMVYGRSLTFDDLLLRMEELQNRFKTVSDS